MRSRFLIPVAMVVLIGLQCLARPSRSSIGGAWEWDVDDTDFVNWNADTLRMFIDSMVNSSEEPMDSIVDEYFPLDVPDSVQAVFDSVKRVQLVADSTERARIAFQRWFDSIPKREQKKWIVEHVTIPAQIHRADSIQAVKDSIRARRDSITENTPRILETPYLPDSLYYRRLLLMRRDMKFGDIVVDKFDTTYNYHYNDYPFFREDVNATWLGVSGSPVQGFNVYKRIEEENATFFTPYRSWTYTPSTLPMYNTKTPYTELGYSGPLFTVTDEELNIHFLTTQNILPSFNLALGVDKYSGGGALQKEKTENINLRLSLNYLGKKYALHAGWIHDRISRTENGGVTDISFIRDTVVDAKEIPVNLASASNKLSKNTFFINHSYRIPFGSDSLTTAFVGHTLDWSIYGKEYQDQISTPAGKDFYHNAFFISPGKSADTMKVTKLDNKLFLRLQPWKETSIVSKIDVGVGDKYLTYHDFILEEDSTGVKTSTATVKQNNIYAYAGAKGLYKQYFNWNADGKVYFAGYQMGDFEVNANLTANFYPFRRHRQSPLTIKADFHTDLTTPDHYEKRVLANHYRWDNDFNRKSTMKIGGVIDIPIWKLRAEVGYTMRGNSLYYDTNGIIRQHNGVVNVISAALEKDFKLWWLHFDNRLLFQYTSNPSVVPAPMLALNLRYYLQFDIVKKVMQMQVGAQCLYNTLWKMPAYNPNLGVFFNQEKYTYGNTPYFDVFVNVQWKRCCIFVKVENIGEGKPCRVTDYFTASGNIHTQRVFKFGIFWPFYIQPAALTKGAHSHGPAGGNPGKGRKAAR